MNTIVVMIFVTALLIVVPVGYIALLKYSAWKDQKKRQTAVIAVFSAFLLIAAFLSANLYGLFINHDERVVAQRYVNALIENSIRGDAPAFLADVHTIAYTMENADEIFGAAKAAGFAENPGLMISESEAKDAEGNVYLYVFSRDLALGLDVELKPSGYFYDVYAVSVLDEGTREAVLTEEKFSPIW